MVFAAMNVGVEDKRSRLPTCRLKDILPHFLKCLGGIPSPMPLSSCAIMAHFAAFGCLEDVNMGVSSLLMIHALNPCLNASLPAGAGACDVSLLFTENQVVIST